MSSTEKLGIKSFRSYLSPLARPIFQKAFHQWFHVLRDTYGQPAHRKAAKLGKYRQLR